MFQHASAHCATCQRPTLQVRNSYDVPHVCHLIAVCAFGMAAIVTRDPQAAVLCLAGCCGWLVVWALQTVVNLCLPGPPYRCAACGSTPARLKGA